MKDKFDVGTRWYYGDYQPNQEKLIKDANLINGLPLLRLEEIIEYKKELTDPKIEKILN